ncbi:MAG: hypothetical protein IPK15_02865 [Verrucomicrobia bacterium]|nr:hypothetical protein [Verrucomicrobiota bacterium]
MKAIHFLILASVLVLGGCASEPKVAKTNPKNVNWSERIGNYTYDHALADLGKPVLIGESGDGKTAEWSLRRSPRVSFGLGVGTGSFGHHGGVGVGVGSSVTPPPRGENLRLKFDKDGKLTEWSKVTY